MSIKLRKEGRQEIEVVMSNFDHEIDHEVGERLKTEHAYAQYSGWNFCGYVWWAEGTFHCEVWHYGQPAEEVSGTLEEIMETVSNEWGDE